MKPRGKKTYHHGDLRNSLLQAAETMLAEHGPAALSLREVAKAAGVSHAAPYRHFHDKTVLLEALAATGFERLQRGCEEARAINPDDPTRQLVEAGMSYLFFAVEKPAIVHLMFGGVIPLENAGEALRRSAESAFQSLAQIVHDGQAAGVYRDIDTTDLTFASWSMVYGLSLMVTTAGLLKSKAANKKQLKRLGETIAEVLLFGMVKR